MLDKRHSNGVQMQMQRGSKPRTLPTVKNSTAGAPTELKVFETTLCEITLALMGQQCLADWKLVKKQHIQNKTCRGTIELNLFGECMSLLLAPGPQDDLGPNERNIQRHDIG